MELGIALAPESRRDQGLCLNLGVGLNINLPIFKRLSLGPSSMSLANPFRRTSRSAMSRSRPLRVPRRSPVSRAATNRRS